MLLNRQISAEAKDYLYYTRTFVIDVYQYGFDFLKISGPLEYLPPLPYGLMKEFVIRIMPENLPTAGTQVHSNLLQLCGLIDQHKIHFRKLRIECMSKTDQFISFWEEDDAMLGSDWPPEISDERWDQPNIDYLAWECDFGSSFAYLISPLRLLYGVADEVVIQLPKSC